MFCFAGHSAQQQQQQQHSQITTQACPHCCLCLPEQCRTAWQPWCGIWCRRSLTMLKLCWASISKHHQAWDCCIWQCAQASWRSRLHCFKAQILTAGRWAEVLVSFVFDVWVPSLTYKKKQTLSRWSSCWEALSPEAVWSVASYAILKHADLSCFNVSLKSLCHQLTESSMSQVQT